VNIQRSHPVGRLLGALCYFVLMGLLGAIYGIIRMAAIVLDLPTQMALDIEMDGFAGNLTRRLSPPGMKQGQRNRIAEMCSIPALTTTMRMQLLAVTLAAMT
jgi:hypothetical protein